MTHSVKLRHVVTGIKVEKSDEEYAAMAFTPLANVYEVLPSDTDLGCRDCGPDEEEIFTEDLSLGVAEDDIQDEDYSFYTDDDEEDK